MCTIQNGQWAESLLLASLDHFSTPHSAFGPGGQNWSGYINSARGPPAFLLDPTQGSFGRRSKEERRVNSGCSSHRLPPCGVYSSFRTKGDGSPQGAGSAGLHPTACPLFPSSCSWLPLLLCDSGGRHSYNYTGTSKRGA